MIHFRTKYWLLLSGANIMIALIGASCHSPVLTGWGMFMAIASWYYAEHLIESDIKEFFDGIKRDEEGE